jgi:hypothetical protein
MTKKPGAARGEMKAIPWNRAAKYASRTVYIRRESTGEYLAVESIGKRSAGNLWIVLKDGRAFLTDKRRNFYTRTGGK